MLSEIVRFRTAFEALPENAKEYCREVFSPILAAESICHLNIGKWTKSAGGTEEILKSVFGRCDHNSKELTLYLLKTQMRV